MRGLSPQALSRVIERLRSDTATRTFRLPLSPPTPRVHFCRAFKESTSLSPDNWLRRYRFAMSMLRAPNNSVAMVAVALGHASQAAFAAAFRQVTGETPTDWRRRIR